MQIMGEKDCPQSILLNGLEQWQIQMKKQRYKVMKIVGMELKELIYKLL